MLILASVAYAQIPHSIFNAGVINDTFTTTKNSGTPRVRTTCVPFILKYQIHPRPFQSKVRVYHMGTRTQRVRRNNILETGITRHTDPCGLWALELDAGRKGMSI